MLNLFVIFNLASTECTDKHPSCPTYVVWYRSQSNIDWLCGENSSYGCSKSCTDAELGHFC